MNKCKHWYGYKHNWGKWKVVEDGDILQFGKIGEFRTLERSCNNCGDVQIYRKKFYFK